MYDFYSQIKKLINSTRDLHLKFIVNENLYKLNAELVYFNYFIPFPIPIDKNKKMYLFPRNGVSEFPINEVKEIVDNQNIPVKTINREDPFNIICEFRKKYMGLECPHTQFTDSKSRITFGTFDSLPLSKERLNTPIGIMGKRRKCNI
ncbi:hypothetical protein EDI_240050 [Entamoeba dispar SAW760]|uniref:Uncharacterized protein n=1 Tax=Entamoeba dispar (strain ATCC PRA-260 / SAW760) TaxID=370354 RepID=B0EKQ2_ENTDS|nr:uncharacterized protein EDI_240050 [Entamoeba dispar SAW760]EDR24900.1 hypothetical protein EDI_240050 [Entamoeba dispar SAW760]|eukprot:EDR24900.1 hypothetical protein EDI_240050 [Entamoeba dispar SAW760]